MRKKSREMYSSSIIKEELTLIRSTSRTTQPKNRIFATSKDIKALRNYLSHKKESEEKRTTKIKITFP